MQQMVFINLPTTDIARSRAFYAGLGYRFDERFCDASSLFVGVSETIHLMLLTRDRFASFSPRPVAPEGTVGALVCLSIRSREEVDAHVSRALAHGGTDNGKVMEEGGFMYGRSVSDPDGNVLEFMWMDVEAALGAQAGAQAA